MSFSIEDLPQYKIAAFIAKWGKAYYSWLIKTLSPENLAALINTFYETLPQEKQQTKGEAEGKGKEVTNPVPTPKPFKPGRGGSVIPMPVLPPDYPTEKPKQPAPYKVEEALLAPVAAPVITALPTIWQIVTTAIAGWAAWRSLKNIIHQFKTPTTVTEFKFGQLLGSNFTGSKSSLINYSGWVNEGQMKKNHQDSYEGFAWWLAYQSGDVDDALYDVEGKGDFYDQGALIWPHDSRSFNAGTSLVFGNRMIGDMFGDFWAKSLNHDNMTLRGITWADVDISDIKLPAQKNYNESGTKSGGPSVDNLAESISSILLKGAVMKGTENPKKPQVALENTNMNNRRAKPGIPSPCAWTMDRNQVIGNQTSQNAVLDVVTNTQLVSVQNKLGPQVAGGITGWLGRFAKSLYLDKALNVINVMLNIHNGVMLSKNLVYTLGEIQTLVINAIGKQLKNEEMKTFDVNQVIGKEFKKLIEGILGKEKAGELTKRIAKYNRIISSATNLMNNLESMLFALSEMMSLAGEYQGKVGNALKRSGVILEDSYEAMQEKWRMMFGKRFAKIDRVLRGIDKGTEVADNLAGIAGEAVEVPEHLEEIGKARKELYTAVKDAAPDRSPGNTVVTQQQKINKEVSQSPEISDADKIKPEAEPNG